MKICSKCDQEKGLDEFNRNRSRKDGYQTYCRDCEKERGKEYRKSGTYLQSTKRATKKALEYRLDLIGKYLSGHPCVDCGIADIEVLDFDHRSDKKFGIMKMVRDARPNNLIYEEIKKCDVVCKNCHAKRTYTRLGNCWRLKYKADVV